MDDGNPLHVFHSPGAPVDTHRSRDTSSVDTHRSRDTSSADEAPDELVTDAPLVNPTTSPPKRHRRPNQTSYHPSAESLEYSRRYKIEHAPDWYGRGNKLTTPRFTKAVALHSTADDDTKVKLHKLVTDFLPSVLANDRNHPNLAAFDEALSELTRLSQNPGSTRDDPAVEQTVQYSIGEAERTMEYSIDPSGVDASIVRRFHDAGAAADAFMPTSGFNAMSPIQPPREDFEGSVDLSSMSPEPFQMTRE
jgi:hypothetical protein